MLELKFGQRGLKLLFLVGFCGEFPMSLLSRYPGYYDYNRRIVTSLVREGYLKERKFRDYDNHVVRSLSLTKKGMEHIQAESPAHAEVILSHELSPASGQGDWKKTLRLHRSAACFLAAHQAGAYWVPGEEKDERSRTQLTYYGAYEFHTRFGMDNKGSRASGIMVRWNKIYALYFLGDHNMRWAEASEEYFRDQVLYSPIGQERYFAGNILIGNEWALVESLVTHGVNRNTRMIHMETELPLYYTTNDPNGIKLLRAITEPATPSRLYRRLPQLADHLHDFTEGLLFDLQYVSEYYQSPRDHKFRIRPAYGYFFDFQMDVMRKINNTNAQLYQIPDSVLDEIISQ